MLPEEERNILWVVSGAAQSWINSIPHNAKHQKATLKDQDNPKA